MVLIDKNETTGWSHMVASSLKELHDFAKIIGCKRFSNKRGKFQPHYDVRGEEFERALDNGAILVSPKTIVKFLKAHYGEGIDRQFISKLCLVSDIINYGTGAYSEDDFTEKRLRQIEKIIDNGEKVYDEFLDENPNVATHLATVDLLKKIFL